MTTQLIPELDTAGLRKFGFTTGVIILVLFGFLLPWLFSAKLPLWPQILALVLFTISWLAPFMLNPIYKVWMRFGLVMGWINTRIILFVIFFGIFMPIGLILRGFVRDPMERRPDARLSSYRVLSEQPAKERLEKPY